MKRDLEEFLTISLISSLLTVICVYVFAYFWSEEGLDFVELAHMKRIYGNVSFITIILVESFLLPVYLVRCYKKKLSPVNWMIQVFALSFFSLVITLFFEEVMTFATGGKIGSLYYTSLEYMVRENLIPDEGYDFDHLSSVSFFYQYMTINILMIFLGNFTGVLTARFMVSRRSFQ